jgi:hypothetical protein
LVEERDHRSPDRERGPHHNHEIAELTVSFERFQQTVLQNLSKEYNTRLLRKMFRERERERERERDRERQRETEREDQLTKTPPQVHKGTVPLSISSRRQSRVVFLRHFRHLKDCIVPWLWMYLVTPAASSNPSKFCV